MDGLVKQGVVSLERLVELYATNAARILKLDDRGSFKPGSRADITIIDPEMTWTFDVSRSKSKSRNTPFNRRTMTGAAVATIVAGRVVFLHPDFSRLTAFRPESRRQRCPRKKVKGPVVSPLCVNQPLCVKKANNSRQDAKIAKDRKEKNRTHDEPGSLLNNCHKC